MRTLPSLVRGAVAVCALIAASAVTAVAQDCGAQLDSVRATPDATVRLIRIARAYSIGCLGGADDPAYAPASVLDAELDAASYPTLAALRRAAGGRAAELARAVDSIASAVQSPHDSLRVWFVRLADSTRQLARVLGGTAAAGSVPLNGTRWQMDTQDRSIAVLTGSDVIAVGLQAACGPGATTCAAATTHTFDLLRYSHMVERIIELAVNRPVTIALRDRMAAYDERWTAYFTSARSQLPWELYLNGRLYGRVKDAKYCESRGGFCSPPANQWILLHPSVAVEYIGESAKGEKVQEAAVLEVVGYNRWSWGEEAAMRRAWGVSLVAAASERASVPEIGYGVMIHHRNTFSIGVTRHESHTGVFLSYDLWNRAQSSVNGLREKFER